MISVLDSHGRNATPLSAPHGRSTGAKPYRACSSTAGAGSEQSPTRVPTDHSARSATATERIASFLLDMHRRSTSVDGRIVDIPMSRMDIADHLGLTIETICRNLAHFRRNGIVAILR